MTGPYNKKSQGSLRRLPFFKISLVSYMGMVAILNFGSITVQAQNKC